MRNSMMFDDHALNIFKAAMPHVHPRMQGGVNLMLQASDLMSTLEEINHPPELSAMEMNPEEHSPEVMLTSIKQVCTPREGEWIDMILNFMNARKIYGAYQDYGSQVLQAAQVNQNRNPFGMFGNLFNAFGGANGFNASNMFNGSNASNAFGGSNGTSGFGGGMMDMFMNFLSPEQRNMFEMMNMMMSTMNMNSNMGNMNSSDATSAF